MKKSVVSLIIGLLAITWAPLSVNGNADELRISGSSTIQPLAEAFAELYRKKASVTVRGGGSMTGIRDVVSNISDIGTVSRALTETEKSRLSFTTIGYDAVAIIVNSRNPLSRITKDALIAIYRGEVKNWKDLSGWDHPIVVVSKQPGRSTLELFENYTGLKHSAQSKQGRSGYIMKNSYEVGSNLEGATVVGGIPEAIGYISVGTAMTLIEKGMPIRILELDGTKATKEEVTNGTYPITRELNFVYRKGNGRVKAFLDLALSREGQKIVRNHGFISVRQGSD